MIINTMNQIINKTNKVKLKLLVYNIIFTYNKYIIYKTFIAYFQIIKFTRSYEIK